MAPSRRRKILPNASGRENNFPVENTSYLPDFATLKFSGFLRKTVIPLKPKIQSWRQVQKPSSLPCSPARVVEDQEAMESSPGSSRLYLSRSPIFHLVLSRSRDNETEVVNADRNSKSSFPGESWTFQGQMVRIPIVSLAVGLF